MASHAGALAIPIKGHSKRRFGPFDVTAPFEAVVASRSQMRICHADSRLGSHPTDRSNCLRFSLDCVALRQRCNYRGTSQPPCSGPGRRQRLSGSPAAGTVPGVPGTRASLSRFRERVWDLPRSAPARTRKWHKLVSGPGLASDQQVRSPSMLTGKLKILEFLAVINELLI